jgi:hypothetical protein
VNEIKAALKIFWTNMQAWVGESPLKSIVLAGAFFLIGMGVHAIFG